MCITRMSHQMRMMLLSLLLILRIWDGLLTNVSFRSIIRIILKKNVSKSNHFCRPESRRKRKKKLRLKFLVRTLLSLRELLICFMSIRRITLVLTRFQTQQFLRVLITPTFLATTLLVILKTKVLVGLALLSPSSLLLNQD